MRDLQYLKTHYLRTVHFRKRRVYDPVKKKLVKMREWGHPSYTMTEFGLMANPTFPLIGYVCPKCMIYGPFDHYMVDGESVCADCALLLINGLPIPKEEHVEGEWRMRLL